MSSSTTSFRQTRPKEKRPDVGVARKEHQSRGRAPDAPSPAADVFSPDRQSPRQASLTHVSPCGELSAALWSIQPAGNRAWTYLVAKRLLDVIGATVILLLLAPVMVLTWLLLVWTTRGRPIFVQQRVGYLGKPFRMYKFRTMVIGAAGQQRAVENHHKDGPIFKNFRDPRITRLGRVLRSLSIDETPQLINVLLGQMSLVGPRPALAEEVRQYKPWQRRRLAVKPGLTCLWQVSGRSEIGFERWMRMDIWYLRHQSLWTDLKLLACTPWCVLTRRGAY